MTGLGPVPEPLSLKLLKGTAREVDKQRRAAATSLAARAPREPSWTRLLPGPDAQVRADARRAWRSIVPELDAAGALAGVDELVLTELSMLVARLRQAEREVSERGIAVEGERGWQKNPAITAANQYRTALRFYVSALGLAPTLRARLDLSRAADDEGAEELFGPAL